MFWVQASLLSFLDTRSHIQLLRPPRKADLESCSPCFSDKIVCQAKPAGRSGDQHCLAALQKNTIDRIEVSCFSEQFHRFLWSGGSLASDFPGQGCHLGRALLFFQMSFFSFNWHEFAAGCSSVADARQSRCKAATAR